jgi:flagellar hook-associated protein 3 FlgL
VAAAHSTRFETKVSRLNQYMKNIDSMRGEFSVAEGYMDSSIEVMQRIRELAVQGANDTYTPADKKAIAVELDQLLRYLVSEVGNSKFADGHAVFAGDRTKAQAFRALEGRVEGSEHAVLTRVDYLGSEAANLVEVADQAFVQSNFPGNDVFWAEPQQIFSDVDASGFIARNDQTMLIDNVEISIRTGDTVYAIIDKINNSQANIEARLDPVQNSLVLKSTQPHQIWIEDQGNGTVLQELGFTQAGQRPPYNLAPGARRSGGSVFDVVMQLRDSLYKGDTLDIGGSGIKGIDLGLQNLINARSDLGIRDRRIEETSRRHDMEVPRTMAWNSNEVDIDLAEALTELRKLEHNHQATLQTTARIMQRTLLDFLR